MIKPMRFLGDWPFGSKYMYLPIGIFEASTCMGLKDFWIILLIFPPLYSKHLVNMKSLSDAGRVSYGGML